MNLRALILAALLVASFAIMADDAEAPTQIAQVLDNLHRATSNADTQLYFAQFTSNARFLGTDAEERWTMTEFHQIVEPYFSQGTGWTYEPTERHVVVSTDGQTAWFDELLHSDKYGLCRSSGVLLNTEQGWKIAQYHLSFPIPNEIAADVTTHMKQWRQSKGEADSR